MTRGIGVTALGAVLALAAVVWVPQVSAANVGVPAKSVSPTEQGMKFYAGKTITFLSPTAPGGTIDEWARNLAPYLGQYLHATVNVTDDLNSSSIPGENTCAAQTPNGLFICIANPLAAVVDTFEGLPSTNFNFLRESFLGQVSGGVSVWVSAESSPITSFKDMISSSTPSYEICSLGNGLPDLTIRAVHKIWNTNGKDLTGYPNTALAVAGFERGDCPVFYAALASVGSFVAAGKARILMATSKPPAGLEYGSLVTSSGAPTFAQVLKQFPPKTKLQKEDVTDLQLLGNVSGLLYMTQSRVPAAEIDALRAAAQWAFKQSSMKTLAFKEGLDPGFVNGSVAKSQFVETQKLGQQLVTQLEASSS